MQERLSFDISEPLLNVLRWFSEQLARQAELEHPGNPPVELRMEGPRTRRLEAPDSNIGVHEIIMHGFRTKGAPIPSDWSSYLIARWKEVWEPLGEVMAFQFHAHTGKTRVWARCDERSATVQWIFEAFLAQIEERYPAVGPLLQDYNTKRELERLQRIERHWKMEAGAADAGTQPQSMDGMPPPAAPATEAAIPKPRRGRRPTDPQEKNEICAGWLEVQRKVTQADFCNRKGISPSSLRSWLKGYPYPES